MIITIKGEMKEMLTELLEVTTSKVAKDGEDAFPVTLKKIESGLEIDCDGKSAVIGYSDRASLCRAVGILLAEEGKACHKKEVLECTKLGNMADCSRNSVLNKRAFEELVRVSALLGHNALLLYTEDTYEIEGEPYFGKLRGRYTGKELHEMDLYAEKFGIELIPCIQTLAHIRQIFFWPEYMPMRDMDDVMDISNPRTYELIEKMLISMKKNLRSRRINVGLDEARVVGLGMYLHKNGYKNNHELMTEHLAKVMELCRKHGYEPMMWSDMFLKTKKLVDYDDEVVVTDEMIKAVPPDANLCYWDYYHKDAQFYRTLMEKHSKFNCKHSFAGGASTWYAEVTQMAYGMVTSRAALKGIKGFEKDTVLLTEWGNGGGCNPTITALPMMILYGEDLWGQPSTDAEVDKKLRIFGASLEDFLKVDDVNYLPCIRERLGDQLTICHNYMMYQDVLMGIWDLSIPEGTNEYYKSLVPKYEEAAKTSPIMAKTFDVLAAMCRFLSVKAELGINLTKAYKSGDKATMKKIADEVIPKAMRLEKEYLKAVRKQWRYYFKDEGLEFRDMVIGSTLSRLENAIEVINMYLDGEIDTISQLDDERMLFYASAAGKPINCGAFYHAYSPIYINQ